MRTLAQAYRDDILALAQDMPDVDLLRLMPDLMERFSGSYGYDKIRAGLDQIAEDLADDIGYESPASIFDPDFSFPRVSPPREFREAAE